MLGKTKSRKQSETLKQFELFLKKRNQSNFILQSETQSVNTKVKCFEELIKLTRAGTPLNFQNSPSEDPHRCKSSKNFIPHTPEPFAEIQQNTEFMAGKFNKMVHQLKSWDVSKQVSTHCQETKESKKKSNERSICNEKSKNEGKGKKMHSSSANISRMLKKEPQNCQEDKCQWLIGSESRPQYFPIRKMNRAYMSRYFNVKKGHNHNPSTPSLNIEIKQQNFTNLKKQINDLENKAKEFYGITFEGKKEPEQEFQDFDPPQKLEFARAIATADGRRKNYHDNYKKLVKQHMKQDSSIPSNFLGFIRSTESKKRPYTQGCSRRYIRV